MSTRSIEIGVGLFVAAGLAALLMLSMKVSNLASFTADSGYRIEARFDNIGGLKVRAPVTMAGVRIGRIESVVFDSRTYEAVVTLAIEPAYDRIPTDSSASIFTAGLLGELYIGLEPGGEETFMKDGAVLGFTQSAIILEQIIGQFLYRQGSGDAGSKTE
jgi:phospholipid/cholesterol/gamma-HCH transport system substrate-binding protein